METRKTYEKGSGVSEIEICDDRKAAVVSPIIAGGDVSGCVVFLDENDSRKIGQSELMLAQTAANFLGKQMEM